MDRCSWCGNEMNSSVMKYCQSEYLERHRLCSYCHLNGHACQSSCPVCWYDLAEKLLRKDNLCSGCFQRLDDHSNGIDENNHRLCADCVQCILCSFRLQTKKEFFHLSYRQHEYSIQRILYHMQNCVQKIEDDYDLCSICMEFLNDQQQIEILSECQHRFHRICIQNWFKQKPCCPCCRHVYQTHDQPKAKRMRTGSTIIPIDWN